MVEPNVKLETRHKFKLAANIVLYGIVAYLAFLTVFFAAMMPMLGVPLALLLAVPFYLVGTNYFPVVYYGELKAEAMEEAYEDELKNNKELQAMQSLLKDIELPDDSATQDEVLKYLVLQLGRLPSYTAHPSIPIR